MSKFGVSISDSFFKADYSFFSQKKEALKNLAEAGKANVFINKGVSLKGCPFDTIDLKIESDKFLACSTLKKEGEESLLDKIENKVKETLEYFKPSNQV